MTINSNRIAEVVEAIMAAEKPASVSTWRSLDDPEADSQPRLGYPLVEFEFPGGKIDREEYGDPGNNQWAEESAFMIHVHVRRGRDSERDARSVMDDVVALFAGRRLEDIEFFEAMAPYHDGKGRGLSAGVSRAVKYRYEFLHR